MDSIETDRYDKSELKEEYEEFYASGDFAKFPIADRRFIEALTTQYGIQNGTDVLSIAAGTGKFERHLAHSGATVTALELSRNAVEIGTKRCEDVAFIQGDALNPPFNKNQFDVVFCHGFSLFNEPDLETTRPFMQAANDLLTDGGLFVFGKTSTLTDQETDDEGRMDHSIETFVDFFESVNGFEVTGAFGTFPHTFIPLGRFGFSNIVTKVSTGFATLLNLPVRVYIVLRKVK